MRIYWFYRPDYIWNFDFQNWTSLNWKYTLSFWLNWQYGDFVKAWAISIKDMEIPENRYTKKIVPWIKDLREFIIYEYNENYIDESLMNKIIWKIWQRFDLELLSIEEAKSFIRKNTNLEEVEEWKFLIQEETIWINWENIEARYLIIN